ncbi:MULTISPECIES: hypothetical protein [unclassified Moraxella]|uniref:hypothetical protein n=1 Tax=unclassified Moraxella TaxID=2685852 RepID=UPI003AF96B4F
MRRLATPSNLTTQQPIGTVGLLNTASVPAKTGASIEREQANQTSSLLSHRNCWLEAYAQRDVQTFNALACKDFFMVCAKEVSKKSDCQQFLATGMGHAIYPALTTAIDSKTSYDYSLNNACIITCYHKFDAELIIIKEMWLLNSDQWQISSITKNHMRYW